MSSAFVESLESRTLFAGVVLEATGRLGGTTGWMQTMADDITARLGGPLQVPQYILSININPTTGSLVPTISHVDGTGTPQTSSSGEIIVLIDYESISTNVSYPSPVIGSVVADYLMNTPVDGVLLASLPIDEIGVSRGTGILDQVANTLGQAGVWVDQETYLDPDPLAEQGDPPSTIYDNVAFVDDYWRNDGSVSQINDGNPVDGAYNLNVSWLDSEDAGYSTPHLAPAGYYIGTIDQTATDSGEGPIYSEWYGDTPTMPARDATGFIYTSLVGAARPLSGLWAASGGTGARTATGQVGAQWGNVTDLAVTSGNTVTVGDSFNVSYIHQDRGGADTIAFYLDTDRNPYNNNFVADLGSFDLAQATAITQGSENLSMAGVAPGTYWLCAKVTNAQGDTRYTYESVTAPITVDRPPSISGTVFNDVNGNGVFDADELGLPGVLVYVDLAGTGQYEPTDPSTTTDVNGNYTINSLPTGSSLIVRAVLPAETRQTTAPLAAVTLSIGEAATEPAIGVQTLASISGTVFNDLNGNGVQDAGEPVLAGRLVYVDLNGSGEYESGDPSATTDANGSYTITDLTPGTYTVREVLPAGTRQTSAPSSPFTLASGQSAVANFGTSETALITGAVVLPSIPSIATDDTPSGFAVTLTEHVKHERLERFTTSTNSLGSFSFVSLEPEATDTVRIVKRKGYKLARHAPGVYRITTVDGQVISGLVFSEVPIVPAHRDEVVK